MSCSTKGEASTVTTSAIPSRYRILETIGRGGMGEVRLAEDLVLDRRVALKFLTSSLDDHSRALDQLLNEARSAAALDHPFICKIYEVTEIDGRPCIVMEYVTGEPLDRRLRRGPPPLAEALRLAEEMAEAIEAAHKRRVVHRDLKPANVIVTEGDHIKVMDFGLATRLPPHHDTGAPDAFGTLTANEGMLLGTPAYMSPEQTRGYQGDRRSDVFAFGSLLYELLSGVQPFHRMSLEATLEAVRQDSPEDLRERAPGMPASVAAVVARMLEKHPAARYQSFGEVRLDLRRLSGELSSRTSPDFGSLVVEPLASGRAPLVGREAEHVELMQAVRHAAAGRGGLIVLEGEAGVGKSRLAEEALTAARRLGLLTLVGRCYEQEGTPPLVPYIEAIEEAARLLPAPLFRVALGRTAPELARFVPELRRLFPEMPAELELPQELRQRFLFNNVREFLTRCAQTVPVLIFLDDLQWADESTLQLTQHLAPHLGTMAVMILGAYREPDSALIERRGFARAVNQLLQRVRGRADDAPPGSHPLTRALEQLRGQRLARVMPVGPLSEAKVGALLGTLAQKEPPAALVRKFFNATGGNPFFVEELFRYLSEEQRLFDPQLHWRRDLDLEQIDVPSGVRLIVGRRLQRLPAQTNAVLQAAAIFGSYFELDLLEAVADVDGDTLLAALQPAEQAHLVKGPSGRQERRWRFAHQLIGQTLTSTLPAPKRQRLHVRAADAMDRLDRGSGAYTSDIAHHLYSAGPLVDGARTARALMAAGRAADAVYATDEAVGHYRRAIEILKEVRGPESDRLAAAERLADLLTLTGDRTEAMEHYSALAASFDESRKRVDQARIVRKIGSLQWQGGDRAQAITSFRRALSALEGEAAHLELAHVHQELGLAAFRGGDHRRAIDWAERALTHAEAALAAGEVAADVKRAAATAIAHATNTIGAALAHSGELEAARERIERSVATAVEHGLLDVACRGYANLGVVYATIEPKRAIDASLTGLDLATRIGATSLQPYLYANLGAAYCALTDHCEAEGLSAARTAADLDRQLGQLDHLAVPLIVMAQIHQCLGDLQQAQDVFREALALAEKAGDPQLLFPCYDGLATIHLDRGDRQLAEEYMQKAQQVCEQAGIDPDTLVVLPFLC